MYTYLDKIWICLACPFCLSAQTYTGFAFCISNTFLLSWFCVSSLWPCIGTNMDLNCRLLAHYFLAFLQIIIRKTKNLHEITEAIVPADAAFTKEVTLSHRAHISIIHAKIAIILKDANNDNLSTTIWSRKQNPPAFVQALIRFLVMPYLVVMSSSLGTFFPISLSFSLCFFRFYGMISLYVRLLQQWIKC